MINNANEGKPGTNLDEVLNQMRCKQEEIQKLKIERHKLGVRAFNLKVELERQIKEANS